MEIIETIIDGLEDLPSREIYYFGPKIVSCSEKQIIENKTYKFELYKYDIKSNGKKYVKMFDSGNKQIFERITIILHYTWAGYNIEFFNENDPKSNSYFKLTAKTDLRLEAILDRLVLMAEKKELFSKEYPSIQYVYAYIIFLFLETKDEKIKASQFSEKYKTLKKMKKYISEEQTDNVNCRSFSKDTVYYKVFDRFVNKQLEIFKSKSIIFD